jgi:5-methylcytosine-specific restriction endonuclease McrA
MTENKLTRALKQAVRLRAKGCCEYCLSQEKFATQSFSIDHIIPTSQEGKTQLDNLALACQGCNNFKYDKVEGTDRLTGEKVPLYHPRKEQWQNHFTWDKSYTNIVGLTPTGRATVEDLKLNRSGLINLRQILYAMDEHPPQ